MTLLIEDIITTYLFILGGVLMIISTFINRYSNDLAFIGFILVVVFGSIFIQFVIKR